jgi:hypothetical protein
LGAQILSTRNGEIRGGELRLGVAGGHRRKDNADGRGDGRSQDGAKGDSDSVHNRSP